MSQKTNEQLIDAIEEIVARYDIDADKQDARIMRQAIERLRQQSEEIDYPTAKRAIKLFEVEYIGQSVPELWRAMVDKARKA